MADRLEDVGRDAFFATLDHSDADPLAQARTSDGSVSCSTTFVRAGDRHAPTPPPATRSSP